jgi:hypothetical protein
MIVPRCHVPGYGVKYMAAAAGGDRGASLPWVIVDCAATGQKRAKSIQTPQSSWKLSEVSPLGID